jgi:abhydrolase domain-containing protein 5
MPATSEEALADAERRMLSNVQVPYEQRFVQIAPDLRLNTLVTRPPGATPESHPPLVMVHGFGSGLGLWAKNLDELSRHYTVYCMDLLGFGRSSRPAVDSLSPDTAEEWWVESIEQWAQAMALQSFFLLGHSLGGFLVAAYAIRYPARIRKLVFPIVFFSVASDSNCS